MAHRRTETFRNNLKVLCVGYGRVTQLAAAAGITREYLSMVIHGKVVPSLDIALQLAEAAELSLDELCEKPLPKPKRVLQAS